MKRFVLFLLSIMLVIAASVSQRCDKVQLTLLKEIIDSVNLLHNAQLKDSHILLKEVIKTPTCCYEDFCKAGTVLSEVKAEKLGLNEAQWLLPRQLSAYTRNINCNVDNSTSDDKVSFFHLLKNIKHCAQKHYRESCGKRAL